MINSTNSIQEVQFDTTKVFAGHYEKFITLGLSLAEASKDDETQNIILGHLRKIYKSCLKSVEAAKELLVITEHQNLVYQIEAAGQHEIKLLLKVSSSNGPGQRHCNEAIDKIEVRSFL